ncbi:hypothetical protein C7B65_18295 [Phormidesmis priestleyi ULC007]|uniref:DUF4231 domain-containing protein n=1 Tax=Phormidesmis priestleyi ULC007 TaxID=1920490 RepID=A0A2T1DAF6_9CYAN|nr:hypothetical protein [Phormidesmis priestleyi]PSB17500.1 hypothetical protein C7B65_18295 [Phormidesmis priestleyi ULC007]PZO47271.1 MAG: hypothetical protein DCF14_20455 [Phormidesmis priestleyi]
MVSIRQQECAALADLLSKEGQSLLGRAKLPKIIIIVLGALVATNTVAELVMINLKSPETVKQVVMIIYTCLGVVISVTAALDVAFRFEEKASKLMALSSSCLDYNRNFMIDFKRNVDKQKPEVTIVKLEALIDSQNQNLANIHSSAIELGVNSIRIANKYKI